MAFEPTEIELAERRELFCQEYLVDLNGTKAAIRAGYAESGAATEAWRLLRNADVQARIVELRQATANTFSITKERIAQELTRIGFSDIRGIFDETGKLKLPSEWTDEQAAAVAGIETDETFEGYGEDRTWTGYTRKVKIWEKVKALEALNRMMGYNAPDKKELSGSLDLKQITGMEFKDNE